MSEELLEFVITFNESNMTVYMSMDMSYSFCIMGDKVMVVNEECDYEYDGQKLTFMYEDEDLFTMTRIGTADKDNVYGQYKGENMFSMSDEEGMVYDFVEDGVTYCHSTAKPEYTYDEENSKLTIIYPERGEYELEAVLDGDKLTITDEKNETMTFTRQK